jgi:hypothetical protein
MTDCKQCDVYRTIIVDSFSRLGLDGGPCVYADLPERCRETKAKADGAPVPRGGLGRFENETCSSCVFCQGISTTRIFACMEGKDCLVVDLGQPKCEHFRPSLACRQVLALEAIESLLMSGTVAVEAYGLHKEKLVGRADD